MPKTIPIPFNENGNLIPLVLEKTCYREATKVAKWIDNPPMFSATVTFVDISKGKYSDRFAFEDNKTGLIYTMSPSDFMKAIPNMIRGTITGVFRYARFRNKYGIAYYGDSNG